MPSAKGSVPVPVSETVRSRWDGYRKGVSGARSILGNPAPGSVWGGGSTQGTEVSLG